MSRERVIQCCEECPFVLQSESEVFTYCMANGEAIIDEEIAMRKRPSWCPLNAGPITVKAGEP